MMGQVQEKMERTKENIRQPLQVKDSGKNARNGRESDGVRWKKGYGGSGRLPGILRSREK